LVPDIVPHVVTVTVSVTLNLCQSPGEPVNPKKKAAVPANSGFAWLVKMLAAFAYRTFNVVGVVVAQLFVSVLAGRGLSVAEKFILPLPS